MAILRSSYGHLSSILRLLKSKAGDVSVLRGSHCAGKGREKVMMGD